MNFLKRLFGSDARIGSHGRASMPMRHYQTCLDCETAYEYDWKMMRRTGRSGCPPSNGVLTLPPASPVRHSLRAFRASGQISLLISRRLHTGEFAARVH
jgi:hypothetical protein